MGEEKGEAPPSSRTARPSRTPSPANVTSLPELTTQTEDYAAVTRAVTSLTQAADDLVTERASVSSVSDNEVSCHARPESGKCEG